ncbi:hypothetical protein EJ07DRAFT_182161 [Lizonia empirigonia]|nr:hypothetical protein EJ07DRAFT_182161 [Lizonia empirigonia]
MPQKSDRPYVLSQADFFRTRLALNLTASEIPVDVTCSICKETCDAYSTEAIVRILACPKCYFHTACIKAWSTSTDQKRGTCPNDRRELFEPNPIKAARLNSSRFPPQRHPEYDRITRLIDSQSAIWRAFKAGLVDGYRGVLPGGPLTDRWHVYDVFATDLPVAVQDGLFAMEAAQRDRTLPYGLMIRLRETIERTEQQFFPLRDLYIRECEKALNRRYLVLARVLSMVYLHPEVTKENIIICGWCVTRDVESLIDFPNHAQNWRIYVGLLARSVKLICRICRMSTVTNTFDSRLVESEQGAAVVPEVLESFRNKFSPAPAHAQPCACTTPRPGPREIPDSLIGEMWYDNGFYIPLREAGDSESGMRSG